ncbi:family 16 glycosylhydrolase [Cellulophaga baltica]|uniref:family 16 glycosylhydrolase n=1 Tax=Cellulophaga baltica TaxID=76594 RepID=UPI002494D6D2|nr:family 16 glycosylhydrolase [Cellulophaga baltica]
MIKLKLVAFVLIFQVLSCSKSNGEEKQTVEEESQEETVTPEEEVEAEVEEETTADWKTIPVPADAGTGNVWEFQELSDDFDYDAPADAKGTEFDKKWTDFYHNQWKGPGLTEWRRENSLVADGNLQMIANRAEGSNKINLGCITSKEQVVYPVYIEANVKIANTTLASDVWLLSSDDTQEIDIVEAYGASYSELADSDQTWYAERIHISHHMFIRDPFQDYQPTDPGSWYRDGTLWREDYHIVGVYWKDPFHLEYYIDGKLVRTTSGSEMIDPNNFAEGKGLYKPMDIIINAEDQTWRSDKNITPSDKELENKENNTFKVDWIRIFKPVPAN